MHSTCTIVVINFLFIQCNGKEISWERVVDLYYQDNAKPVHLKRVPKLKYEHIQLTSFSKMRVDLAAQVLFQNDVMT